MKSLATTSRRDFLAATTAALATAASAADPLTTLGPRKPLRIGVISSSINGKPQRTNGHTYHFAHGFHPTVDLKMIEKHLSKGPVDLFKSHFRNPKEDFAKLPFDNTVISAYYDADPTSAQMFADCFPGVAVARTLDELVKNSDAIWVGDASGRGEDHFVIGQCRSCSRTRIDPDGFIRQSVAMLPNGLTGIGIKAQHELTRE